MKIISLVFLTFCCLSTAFAAEGKQSEEDRIELRVVRFADSDATRKENRLLIFGADAFRSVDQLKKRIAAFRSLPRVLHLVVHGSCFPDTPHLTSEEIDDLRQFCKEQGLRFTYYPAG
jgi:hypothetical protein